MSTTYDLSGVDFAATKNTTSNAPQWTVADPEHADPKVLSLVDRICATPKSELENPEKGLVGDIQYAVRDGHGRQLVGALLGRLQAQSKAGDTSYPLARLTVRIADLTTTMERFESALAEAAEASAAGKASFIQMPTLRVVDRIGNRLHGGHFAESLVEDVRHLGIRVVYPDYENTGRADAWLRNPLSPSDPGKHRVFLPLPDNSKAIAAEIREGMGPKPAVPSIEETASRAPN